MTFAWAHVGVNTNETARAILIVMELNLSGTFVTNLAGKSEQIFVVLNDTLDTI